ncbi:MAG: hypothetical protein L0I76_20725 [Pseudonocardia sp.]|nr:hypothetical protein [Pseudonocardia sp.]
MVGYKIDRRNHDSTVGIPVTLGRKPANCFLAAQFRLRADDEGRYPAIETSFVGLFLDEELDRTIAHWDYERDYERDKRDGYPEAHLQVCATSSAWDELCAATRGDGRALEKLHFPTGLRRYRTTLEDVIDFLIAEKIAEAHPSASEALAEGREKFRRTQLRAAVRRDPETAISILREMKKIE